MLHTVPVENIIAICVTTIFAFLLPVVMLLIVKKKTNGNISPVFIGAGTFIVFALILESILHNVVLAFIGRDNFMDMWFYAIYGGLAAGIFEETGRLLSMKLLMKKTLRKGNSLMFGIGHGGAEILILAGLTGISNIITAVMINTGVMEASLSALDESMMEQTVSQLSTLWTSEWYMFILSMVERAAAFALQLCLSYIVYRCVRYKKPLLYVLAVFIHALVDGGVAILSRVASLYITEALLAAVAVCLVVVTIMMYRSEKEEYPEPEAEQEAVSGVSDK